MKDIIIMSSYEEFDSESLIGRVTAGLNMGGKVILDFREVIGFDFKVLESFFTSILERVGYDRIKTLLGFKNVNEVIRRTIKFIVDEYQTETEGKRILS